MRQYVYEIVYRTLEQGGHSDELFHHMLYRHPEWEQNRKSYLKKLSYGTVERKIEMDACINQVSKIPADKMDAPVRTVLRMAFYELRYMGQANDAAVCDEAVKLVRKVMGERPTGFVNGVLREYLRRKEKICITAMWQKLSLPEELMNHLISQYGVKTAEKIGRSFLEKGGEVTLHVNTRKILKEEYTKILDNEGITWRDGAYFDEALIVPHSMDIRKIPGYEQGYFFVQDESSMLPVTCAGIHPGDTVMDVCCAPGGKSMHALLALDNGILYARDVNSRKLDLTKENIARLGFSNVSCELRDALAGDTEMVGKVDVLLADVPCSGIGIIGRKPEIKYRAMEQAKELVSLQRAICKASVPLLKPGGTLIYSTCTINHAENEENVQWLIQEFGLVPESLNDFLPPKLKNRMGEQGMLQVLPGLQECDGFFVARLRKKEM